MNIILYTYLMPNNCAFTGNVARKLFFYISECMSCALPEIKFLMATEIDVMDYNSSFKVISMLKNN